MLYIREDIPSKSLTEIKLDNEIENIFIEINLRSKKWLISGSYNPKMSNIKNHLLKIYWKIIYWKIIDWKSTIADRAKNVLELRRRDNYWEHKLDTFVSNGLNERFVGIPVL